jgi:Sec-independent protein translocase protein TatA
MDSFFGIGLAELLVILLLAGLVMGPQRVRQVARTLGRLTARLQSASRAFMRQLNAELDTVDSTGELKATIKEVRDLRRQVTDLRQEVKSAARSFAQEEQAVTEGLRAASRQANQAMLAPAAQPESESLPRPVEVPGDSDE